MEYFKIGLFIVCVILTLDYITDVIEVMSNNSKDHKQLGQTTPDFRYLVLTSFAWGLFYAIEILVK